MAEKEGPSAAGMTFRDGAQVTVYSSSLGATAAVNARSGEADRPKDNEARTAMINVIRNEVLPDFAYDQACELVDELKILGVSVKNHLKMLPVKDIDELKALPPLWKARFSEYVLQMTKEKPSSPQQSEPGAQPKKPEDTAVYQKLSPKIRFFRSKPLSEKPTAKIFEGEMLTIAGERPVAVAIKVVNYHERNLREAKNLVKLCHHTNVVAIHKATMHDEDLLKQIYIVMERCNTLNLEKYIKVRKSKGVPFNLQQAFSHAKQVIDGIHHIHDNGIIHRDLKPSSVLFSKCGRYLKIADFGVSKELKNGCSVVSVSTLKIGTDGYRAPETYSSNKLSKMADIFSLGLVLFYLWSYGLHPFGLDPEGWNLNIKNKCQKLDLSGLLLPNSENAKSLLREMLKFAPDQRIIVDDVKSHIAVREDVTQTTIDSMDQIWNGKFRKTELVCTLYQMPHSPDFGLAKTDWIFEMNNVTRVDWASTKNIISKAPDGYIAAWPKKSVKKLTDNFHNNAKMGWLSMLPRGKDRKALVLTCSDDYPELFGIFIQDLENFASRDQSSISSPEHDEEDSPEPVPDMGNFESRDQEHDEEHSPEPVPDMGNFESRDQEHDEEGKQEALRADHERPSFEGPPAAKSAASPEEAEKKGPQGAEPQLIPWWSVPTYSDLLM